MYDKQNYKLQQPSLTSGAYYALFKLFSEEKIISLMKRFDYSDENFAIMAGDKKWLKENNPDFFRPSRFAIERKDSRTVLQYAQDLVANWLYEDIVEKIISVDKEIHISKNGVDKNRQFLVKDVTYATDFVIEKEGEQRPLELTMDYNGYLERRGFFHLRESKYQYLERENALLLIIDTCNNLCVVMDFKKPHKHKEVKVDAWGHKTAQEVYVSRSEMFPLSSLFTLLKEHI